MLKRLLYLPLMVILFTAGLLLNKLGFERIEALRRIERIPRSSINALIPGEANVRGVVKIHAGKQLKGPDSGSVCVYYKYKIEKKTTDSDGNTKWETTHSETRFVPFALEDESGVITVYPVDSGTVTLAKKHSRTAGNLRYTELRIDPGMNVFAMGMAQRTNTGMSLVFDAPGTYVPILSVKTEAEERGAVGLFSLLFTVAGLAFLSLSIYAFTRLTAIHQTLTYLTLVAVTIMLCMLVQSHKMIQNDLQAAYERLAHEREVRQQEVSALLNTAGITWEGDWNKLYAVLQASAAKLRPATRAAVETHRINLMRSILRTERIRQGFPESWIAASMGLEKPDTFELSPEEQTRLQKMEGGFVPSRISHIAAAILGAAGIIGALLLGGTGIHRIKTKRWIENIPTVKTKGAVYGINEIKGEVLMPEGSDPLRGPLSNQPCVAYHYVVKERRRSGKKTHWVVITDEKQEVPFLCHDTEGAIPVMPDDAELLMKTSTKRREGKLLYIEKIIPAGAKAYVLGSAVINPETHDSLVIAKGDDSKMPFIISDYAEETIVARKAAAGFLMLNLGFNFFMLAGFGFAGYRGGFGAVAYITAAITPLIYLLLFMIAVLYNDLIFLLRRCDSMWANIDVALKKRFDLLPQLVNIAKKYIEHEKALQEQVAALRAGGEKMTPGQADQKVAAENTALQQITGLVENYPELKGNEMTAGLMKSIRNLEDEVALMREGYNHAVETYNSRIAKLPEVFLARIFHFRPRELFSTADRSPVDVN